jgi:tRNA threonylcarbamoyladenosine biosynthesis protein TsaB
LPILALDTSTLVSSVAIASSEKLIAELILQTKLTHSEVLMPHIEQILAMTKIKKTDLTGIAVSIGPGSFTGLRIGLAAAKGMAYALKLPIVGVSTLAALAYHYPMPNIYIAPLLDAQKGNVYTALYRWENGILQEVQAPAVKSFDMVLQDGQALDLPVVFVGDTAQKQALAIAEAGGNVVPAMPQMVMPRAANVAMLGLSEFAKGKMDHVMQLEPVYIRRSEAEVLWERRNGKSEE